MKKIIIASTAILIGLAACKKEDNVSQVVKVSYPTITLTGSQFYSIKTGDPIPNVTATAYDSTLHESYPAALDASGIDNSTPALYVVPITAKNKYGYVSSVNVYIAVTDIAPAADLTGDYVRAATGYTVHVEEIENGLYSTSNFFGVDGLDANAYFVQLDDSTIDVPTQPTDLGTLSVSDVFLTQVPGDTSFGFKLQTLTSNRTLRIFEKQ